MLPAVLEEGTSRMFGSFRTSKKTSAGTDSDLFSLIYVTFPFFRHLRALRVSTDLHNPQKLQGGPPSWISTFLLLQQLHTSLCESHISPFSSVSPSLTLNHLLFLLPGKRTSPQSGKPKPCRQTRLWMQMFTETWLKMVLLKSSSRSQSG